MANRKKRNNGMIIVCWILIILFILIAFIVQKDKIATNLKNTDFFNRVFGSTPEFIKKHDDKAEISDNKIPLKNEEPAKKEDNTERYSEVTGSETSKVYEESKRSSQDIVIEEILLVQKDKNEETVVTTPIVENKSEEKITVKKTDVNLYFVVIDSDGSVSRKLVTRSLNKSDSPLTDSINELLLGPSYTEKNKNCMTLIPEGTKLLGASVKNGTATLNFNENFEFNSFGVEGYIAQLMQIVYTATEFSTVKNVQFLIEGEKKDYLGSEGQWIGSPLARTSF